MGFTVIYPKYAEHHGFATAGSETYDINYFGAMFVAPNREFLLRFADTDLPAGVTITSANIVYHVGVKNRPDPNSFTFDHFYESNAAAGATINQITMPFRVGVAEESTANRHWVSHLTGQTFTWAYPGVGSQELQVNVTSLIQQAYANSGRHMALAFKMKVNSESGDLYMENTATLYTPYLIVQYVEPKTFRNEVVLANENPNMMMYNPTTGIPDAYYKNSVYGFFSEQTTYATAASFGSIVAPYGGNVVRVTANDTHRQAIWCRSPSTDRFFGGSWSVWSGFVYVPAGVSDVQISTGQNLFTSRTTTSTKDAWVRMYIPYLHSEDESVTIGFASTANMTSGQSFYVANVNWTNGEMLYPYFDGNFADTATYHRTFNWGGGTTGLRDGGIAYVTLDNAPTATILDPQAAASTHSKFDIRWTYSDPYGEGQQRYRVNIRKKRVP